MRESRSNIERHADGMPEGTLGRKNKYGFKEFYNSLFDDLVNPDKLILLGTETLNLS